MALDAGGSLLCNLPSSRPELFSKYDPDTSKKAAPRLAALCGDNSAQPATVVRSEGTSVLVRELERVRLRNKAAANRKRAAQVAASQQRKRPRGRMPAHAEQQTQEDPGEDEGQLHQQQQQQQ